MHLWKDILQVFLLSYVAKLQLYNQTNSSLTQQREQGNLLCPWACRAQRPVPQLREESSDPSVVTLFPLGFMETLYYMDLKKPYLLLLARAMSIVMSVSKNHPKKQKAILQRRTAWHFHEDSSPADPCWGREAGWFIISTFLMQKKVAWKHTVCVVFWWKPHVSWI